MSPSMRHFWCLIAVSLPVVERATAGPLDPLNVYFVAGHGAANRVDDEKWSDKRLVNFTGQKARFISNKSGATREQFLKLVQNADIFYYSGHFGTPKDQPDVQVFLARPTDPNSKRTGYVTARDIRAALSGKRGPRLVIVNGCESSEMDNAAVAAENQMPSGFGISNATEGRAYLGWSRLVVGFVGDDQIGRLLDTWTTPDNDGNFPTLEEAQAKAGIKNLVIIGDRRLRYNTAFLVGSADSKAKAGKPMRLLWQLTAENKAVATLDLGGEYEKDLRKMGFNRKLKLNFVRDKDGFVLRDEQFGQFMGRFAEEMAAGLGGLFDDKPSSIKAKATVREASIVARAEGENLRFTVKLHISTTVTRPKQPPKTEDTLKGAYDLIGKPEKPVPRVPS